MVGRRGGGSLTRLREAHTAEIVEALGVQGPMTQAALARATGLSPATVSNIVGDLRRRGIVRSGAEGRGDGRSAHLTLDPGAGIVVGVDFGDGMRRVVVCDLAHAVLAEERHPLKPDHCFEDGLRDLAADLDRLLERTGRRRSETLGVGVGVPAPVDPLTGVVGSPGILPGWAGVRLADRFSEALGVRVVVDNDANLAALGELHDGAGRGCHHFAYLKVTTGIGAGLVLDGRLYRGVAGTAGEIGHTTLDENGPMCRCGNRGCLELFASTPAVLELLRRRDAGVTSVRRLLGLSADGDPGCRRVLEDAGRHIGMVLANLCNLISPERIVVGGELVAAGDALLQPMRESMARGAVPGASGRVAVVPGDLGDRAGVLGAVVLALQHGMPALVGAPDVRGGGGGGASRHAA